MRREWELEDLIECWTLDEAEFELLANKTGATRLGFALLIVWLAAGICPMEMSPDRLRAALLARCRQEKVEPPAPARTERLLVAAEAMFERQFTQATAGRLSTESIGKLEELIVPGAPAAPADAEGREAGEDGTGPEPGPGEEARAGRAGGGRAFLQELKDDPGPLTLETLLAEIGKLERVKALKLPDGLFEGVSEKIVAGWRARAMKMYPSDLAGAPDPIRITLLAALCHVRRAEMVDGLVELLIRLVRKISVRAERKVESEINSEFRRVHGKNGILVRLAEAAPRWPATSPATTARPSRCPPWRCT